MRYVNMKNKISNEQIFFILSVIISIGIVITLFSTFTTSAYNVFFNSDTLYLPSIYKDLFIDHNSLNGWHLNPAPNIFPDMIVYFIISAFTSNFIIASFVFAIFQYLFLIYLIFRLFKAIELPNPKLIATISNLLLLLFFMVSFYSNDFGFTFYLVSNSYHTGAFLMSLLCTVMTLEYLKNSKKSTLVFLIIISFLSVFSDRLFIAMYIIPWSFVMILYFKIIQKRKILTVFFSNIFVTILGLIALDLMR